MHPSDDDQASAHTHTDEDTESTAFLVGSEQVALPTAGKIGRPLRVAAAVVVVTCLAFAVAQLLPVEHSAEPEPSDLQGVVTLSKDDKDFCDSPWKNGINAKDFASTAVCQSVCPCCSGIPLPHSDCADEKDASRDAGNSLQQKWELDDLPSPRQLLIKSGAPFLKSLWKSCKQKYSFKEIVNHTFYDMSPSQAPVVVKQWAEMQKQRGWSDPEMAMFGYTAELFYGPMNKMLREATSMADINDWWQSYIALLQNGLENYAKYVDAPSYRGVKNCDGTQFHGGGKGVLPQFTSTSQAKRVALRWASACNGHNPLVIYFTGGGYDISKYSFYPDESELLLEPGREFVVGSVEEVKCVKPNTKKETTFTVVHRLTHGPTQLKTPEGGSDTKPQYTCPKHHLKSCEVCRCCSTPGPVEKA